MTPVQRIKLLSFQIILTFVLLLGIETIALFYLKKENKQQPFFINTSLVALKTHQQLKGHGFYLVDPLLGWGYTDRDFKKISFENENGCFVLKTSIAQCNPVRILITGGSTSDIGLHTKNWPTELYKILEDSGICANVYVASIGGYNSGQELLKMIRDGISLYPDIHISYSGANEYISPSYISRQEHSFYRNAFAGKKNSVFIPNTLTILSRYFNSETNELELYEEKRNSPALFWKSNMRNMHGLATANGYTFLGILQPVLGVGSYQQPNVVSKNKLYVGYNQDFYPTLFPFIDSTIYLENFTNLFDTCSRDVFVDDCHINDEFQKVVAWKVYKSIRRRGLLNNK